MAKWHVKLMLWISYVLNPAFARECDEIIASINRRKH